MFDDQTTPPPAQAVHLPAGCDVELRHHGEPMVWTSKTQTRTRAGGRAWASTNSEYICHDPDCSTTVHVSVRELAL